MSQHWKQFETGIKHQLPHDYSPQINLLVGTSYSEHRCIRGCSWSLSKVNDLDLLFPCHSSGNTPKMASNTSCRTITHHKLLVGTSYSEHRCIRGCSWSLSKVIDLDLLFLGHGSETVRKWPKHQSPHGYSPQTASWNFIFRT